MSKSPDVEKDDQGENTKLDYDAKTIKGELAVKVICLGDSAVGKSKLLERFLVDSYKHQQLSTFALTLYRHRTTVDNTPVLVDFWDTAGQERFQTMHASYYHQAHAAVLVFDGTRKVTYKNLATWHDELRQHRPEIPALCAVNKIDENKDIGGKSFAFPQKNNLPLYYVSASEGTNVVKLFEDAIRAAYEYKLNPTDLTDQILEELSRGEEEEGGGGEAEQSNGTAQGEMKAVKRTQGEMEAVKRTQGEMEAVKRTQGEMEAVKRTQDGGEAATMNEEELRWT